MNLAGCSSWQTKAVKLHLPLTASVSPSSSLHLLVAAETERAFLEVGRDLLAPRLLTNPERVGSCESAPPARVGRPDVQSAEGDCRLRNGVRSGRALPSRLSGS